jgi:succinate dehydrogenase / fumarate reductase, cytochrome b subunit
MRNRLTSHLAGLRPTSLFRTSIIKKVVMALTGLGWFGFLITHLSGNLLIYQGAETFNAYPAALRKFGFLLYIAEAGLVVLLLGHVVAALKVTLENRRARGQAYAVRATNGRATFASRTMALGGVLLLLFIVIHIRTFKFGDWTQANGLWGLVVSTYKNPLMVGWYVFAMILLGLHLSHGLASSLQTLGLGKPVWRARFRTVGFIVGWLMAGGFMSLPIWCYLVPQP